MTWGSRWNIIEFDQKYITATYTSITSLREAWAHNAILSPPHFIWVPVISQKVSGHVFVCKGYQFTTVCYSSIGLWNFSDRVVYFVCYSFPVVDWFCLFIYLWVLTFPLEDCSEFGNFVITLNCYLNINFFGTTAIILATTNWLLENMYS